MKAAKELEKLEQQRKALNAKLSNLDKQREKLRKAARREKAEAVGLVPGTKYRVIPTEQSGEIMEGTFRKLSFGLTTKHTLCFACPAKAASQSA